MKNSFTERVLDIVKKIPKGKTMTYAQVAKLAGNAKASRVVGSIMKANFKQEVPCHRVVRSDGYVGDYNRGGSSKKFALLKSEGVSMDTMRK